MTYRCKYKGKHAINLEEFEFLHNLDHSNRDLWLPDGMVERDNRRNKYTLWVNRKDNPWDEETYLRNDLANFVSKNKISLVFDLAEYRDTHDILLVLNSEDQYCMFELMFSEYIEKK